MVDYNNITVIIPSVEFNDYLKKCIDSIFEISLKINVIILLDSNSNGIAEYKNDYNNLIIKVIKKKLNISQKRNFGAKLTNTDFIAFIDSDAFPEINWLKNSFEIIEKNPDIYIVGGPNISPFMQDWQKKIIGEVQKSFLITGKWNFQKRISMSRFTENLYSCNMFMRLDTYLDYNGMNEELETGEDYDFCNKVNDNKKRVFFNQNSIVYHYDRGFKNFLIQKIIRGFTIVDQIKKKSKLINKNFFEFYIYQLTPFYFFVFNIISILILFNFVKTIYYFKIFIVIIYLIYLLLALFSMKYIHKKNIKYSFLILIFILLGNIFIGLGSLLSLFNLNKIYKFYKNF